MPEPIVNLFVVGAPKAGTTSLSAYCENHSQMVTGRVKEPNYFGEYRSPDGQQCNTIDEYEKLYKGLQGEQSVYIADFSTSYLYSTKAAREISLYNANAKIIILLRDPVERSISMYFHQRKSALESVQLEPALNAEEDRIRDGWGYGYHYKSVSLYHDQVKRYLDVFGSNVGVFFFEEFIRQPAAVLEQVASFLGLTEPFTEESIHLNRTGMPRSVVLQKIIAARYPGKELVRKIIGQNMVDYIIASNIGKKPDVDETIKSGLREYFTDDIRKLELLLRRKTGWL